MTTAVEEKTHACKCGLAYSNAETLDLHFRVTGHTLEGGAPERLLLQFRCGECDLETTRGPLGCHQTSTGHQGCVDLELRPLRTSSEERKRRRSNYVRIDRETNPDNAEVAGLTTGLTERELRALDIEGPDELYFRDASRANADAMTMAGLLKEREYALPCTFPENMDLFTSEKPNDIAAAEEVCLTCPIMDRCPYAGITIKPLGPDQTYHRRHKR